MPNLSSGTSSFKRPGVKFFIVCAIRPRPLEGTHSVDSIVSRSSDKLGHYKDFTRSKPFMRSLLRFGPTVLSLAMSFYSSV